MDHQKQFVVVILATRTGLGLEYSDEKIPAVLPFGEHPLLIHHLCNAIESAFLDIIVVHESGNTDVPVCIEQYQSCYSSYFHSVHIKCVPIPLEISRESATILLHIQNHIKSSCVVIEGNSAFQFPLYKLVDTHIIKGSVCTVVLKDRGEKGLPEGAIKTVIGYEESSSQLAVWMADDENYTISSETFVKFPCIRMSPCIENIGVYAFDQSIFGIMQKHAFHTIGMELIPTLVNLQIAGPSLTESASSPASSFNLYCFLLKGEMGERITSPSSLKLVQNMLKKSQLPFKKT
ncbi:hypothetical protein BLNAU_6458 [Blattamonas nauphoetae]|uniref:Translation initiation factor eIF2B subunit gamma n=1 Tax=Blattamonas nauphoetae TaxID=2049346 RepID=A0ABQ9Y4T8_9EUKA|nr:hypothetical protein BLNAU_6458 [Blattamonas nauphoetae]